MRGETLSTLAESQLRVGAFVGPNKSALCRTARLYSGEAVARRLARQGHPTAARRRLLRAGHARGLFEAVDLGLAAFFRILQIL